MSSLAETLSPRATTMIRMDHSHVLTTFHRYKADTAPGTKKALAESICLALEIHAQLEEEIFYPAVRAVMPADEVLAKSIPEHDQMRRLIAEVRAAEPGSQAADDAVFQLMRDVIHHVADEETVMLPAAERMLGERLGDLGAQMTRRRLELAGPQAGRIAANLVRGMPATTIFMLVGTLALGMLLAGRSHPRRAARWD